MVPVYWPYSGQTDFGNIWCTRLLGDDGQVAGVRVESADPRVLIGAQLLAEFHEGMLFGSLRCAGDGCPVGDVIRLDGVNRSVIYVVKQLDTRWPESCCYIAEWPD